MYKEFLNKFNKNKISNRVNIFNINEKNNSLNFDVDLFSVGENIIKSITISKIKNSQLIFLNVQDFIDFFNAVVDEKEKLVKTLTDDLKIKNVNITKFFEGSEEESAYFVFEGYKNDTKITNYYEPYELLSELKIRLNM